jgi:hypothetical protein
MERAHLKQGARSNEQVLEVRGQKKTFEFEIRFAAPVTKSRSC